VQSRARKQAVSEFDQTSMLAFARGSRVWYGLSASIRSLESAGLIQSRGKTLCVTELWEKCSKRLT
jgi:hypothetical protein